MEECKRYAISQIPSSMLALNIKVKLFMLQFGRMLLQNEYLGKDLSSKDLKPRQMKIRNLEPREMISLTQQSSMKIYL
jgi:hypothetical protein